MSESIFKRATIYDVLHLAKSSQPNDSGRMNCPLPGHTGSRESFSVTSGAVWKCFGSCARGGGILDLMIALGLASTAAEAASVLEEHVRPAGYASRPVIAATYPYLDEHSKILYETVRYSPKNFKQRVPLGYGNFAWSLKGISRVLRHLPDLLARKLNETIWLVEGERDDETLRALGLCSTTSAGGSSWRWTTEFIEPLRGAPRAIVLADCDEPGRRAAHARATLLASIIPDVRIVDLDPNRVDGFDVSDWIADGHTLDELLYLAERAQQLEDAPSLAPLTPEEKVGAVGVCATTPRRVTAVSCSSVDPVEATYLVHPYVPNGEATWFEGATKTGKTTVALDIVARVSTGTPWLDGLPIPQGAAAILTCEDDVARTIVPRLIAAKANLKSVHVIRVTDSEDNELTPSFVHDLVGIEEQLRRVGARVLVVDGTFGVLGAKDGNAYVEAYQTMGPVIAMVRRLNIAAIFVRHVRKTASAALDAGLGSVGYASLARSTVSFKVDHEDESARFMAHAGTNGAISGETRKYRIVDGAPVPGFTRAIGAVEWLEAVSETANDLMGASATAVDRCLIEVAEDWLREQLTDEPQVTSSLREAAETNGISVRTLQRAAKNIGVVMRKGSRTTRGTWASPTLQVSRAPHAPLSSSGVRGVSNGACGPEVVRAEVHGKPTASTVEPNTSLTFNAASKRVVLSEHGEPAR
jgi:hypothetical protein